MLPNVAARDVGNPTAAGEYCVNEQYFMVDNRHVAAWQADPETVFRTVLCTKVGDDRIRFALASACEA